MGIWRTCRRRIRRSELYIQLVGADRLVVNKAAASDEPIFLGWSPRVLSGATALLR
jgi:hypothetical protein